MLVATGVVCLTGNAAAQVGPGMFDPPAGEAPSIGENSGTMDFPSEAANPTIGETSRRFMDNPTAGSAPSIGENSRTMDFPSAAANPSIGETSGVFAPPPAGEAPSIGGANRPFDEPGEGAPYGRLRPFGD